MILNLEEMKKVTFGAGEVLENEKGFAFRRFSEAQLSSLEEYHNAGKSRPTSVYFDFETDASALTLSYVDAWSNTKNAYFNFSLFVNGVLTDCKEVCHRTREEGEERMTFPDGSVTFDLPCGTKRVTLYLPQLFIGLKSLSLSGTARLVPVKRKGKSVIYGDSITEGFYSEVAGMGYFDQLCRTLDCEGLNFALSGSTFRASYLPPDSVPLCDRVLVSFGTNDFRHSKPEIFHDQMPAFFSRLFEQVKTVPVYVILPIWRVSEKKVFEYGAPLSALKEAIAREVEKYPNAVVIDGGELMPHATAFLHDVVHPNALGHTHYAQGLAKRILAHEASLSGKDN